MVVGSRRKRDQINEWGVCYLLLANDDPLWVRENSGDRVAHWAFDVHEEGIWGLNLSLELVLGSLVGGVNVEKIDFHVAHKQ